MTAPELARVAMRVYIGDRLPTIAWIRAAESVLAANPELRADGAECVSRETAGDVYRAFLRNGGAS